MNLRRDSQSTVHVCVCACVCVCAVGKNTAGSESDDVGHFLEGVIFFACSAGLMVWSAGEGEEQARSLSAVLVVVMRTVREHVWPRERKRVCI